MSVCRSITIVTLLLVVIGCAQPDSQSQIEKKWDIQPGDMIFQSTNCGPFCDAIANVTTGYNGRDFSHVGMVVTDTDGLVLIEAVSRGVVKTEIDRFLARSTDPNDTARIAIGRLKQPYRDLIPKAKEHAANLLAKPYDHVFDIQNDSYYCSELIYEIFTRANNGKPIFDLEPMTFKNPQTGEIDPLWKDYFEKHAAPVPEGEPGINPGSLSRSEILEIIYCY